MRAAPFCGENKMKWLDVERFESSNKNVIKFVFKNDSIAESVLYKYNTYEERTVICCSTQSGCPVGCTFCGTGKKFLRNLDFKEIVEQVDYLINHSNVKIEMIKNFQIMFMSMGEPFLNFEELKKAIYVLNYKYPNAKLLVSTSAPFINFNVYSSFFNLAKEIDKIGLQFSLHESSDENRKLLIPTKTLQLIDISSLGLRFFNETTRKPFLNYCVHNNNCSDNDVENLIQLFDPNIFEFTLSVICEKDENIKSSIDRQLDLINNFNQKLIQKGYSTRVFNPAGQDDIGGGCGQLWFVQKFFDNIK